FEIGLDRIAALADPLAFEGEPRARLLNNIVLDADVDHIAHTRNTFVIKDVELNFAEGRGKLIFHHLHTHAVPNDLLPLFDHVAPSDVEADRSIKLKRIAARRGFGVPIENADLRTELIRKNDRRSRLP